MYGFRVDVVNWFPADLSRKRQENERFGWVGADSMMASKVILSAAAALTIGHCDSASAEEQVRTVERTVKSAPNRDTQIGIYFNVLPDCSSGRLPTIRLAAPPASGKVVVKTGKVKATNYKACLALEVPAYIAFYKSPADFFGDDILTLEVKYEGGRTEFQKITVKVTGVGAQQKI
jgi:hypothetical protein